MQKAPRNHALKLDAATPASAVDHASAVTDSSQSARSRAATKPIHMEIVLLWLDDLDDLVICGAHLWEGLRQRLLQIGLAAALLLALCELSMTALAWSAALAGVAASSVSAWFFGAFCILLQRLDAGRQPFA